MSKWTWEGPTASPAELKQTGPLLRAAFVVSDEEAAAYAERGEREPEPIPSTRLVVDTGSFYTLLDERIPQRLGVMPSGFEPIAGVSGSVDLRPVYRLGLYLDMVDESGQHRHIRWSTDFVGMRPRADYDGLIGRDFLAYFTMVYDGPRGLFRLTLDR